MTQIVRFPFADEFAEREASWDTVDPLGIDGAMICATQHNAWVNGCLGDGVSISPHGRRWRIGWQSFLSPGALLFVEGLLGWLCVIALGLMAVAAIDAVLG